MTTLFALALLAADPVEIPKHLAETVYEGDLAEAKRIYDLAVAAATERCKAALERASKSATTNGELDKAVAYRDRAKALAAPDPTSTPTGKYHMRYANKYNHVYAFSNGKLLQLANDSGTFDKPVESVMLWGPKGGFAFWPSNQGSGAVEMFTWQGGKLTSLFYPQETALKGVGEKAK
jgi:hypothetical protein